MPTAAFHRVVSRHPGDVQPLMRLLADGVRPDDVVALWCKTAGHGLANDVTRPYAELCLLRCLADASGKRLDDVRERVQVVVSGGCEGAIVPHLVVVSVARDVPPAHVTGVVVATAREAIAPELVGTQAHVERTQAMVQAASRQAGIEAAADIRFVMVRTPAPAAQPAMLAAARRAAALGVARAREEAIGSVSDAPVCDGSAAAFVVARPGDEVQHVVVLGQGKGGSPQWRIGATVLRDPLDAPAVSRCLGELGLRPDGVQLSGAQSQRVVAAFVKGDVPASALRDLPHAMDDDPLMPAHRHARAAYGGMVAAVLGMPACFVSAGAEGHGPAQGGSFAAIVAA